MNCEPNLVIQILAAIGAATAWCTTMIIALIAFGVICDWFKHD